MKSIFYSLILITILVSCQSTDSTKDNSQSANPNTIAPLPMDENFQNLGLEGSIDGKYDIFMELFKNGQTITGEMLYLKTGKPFSVEGSESNGVWTIAEKADGNRITGIFEGKFENNTFKGTWTNPANKKSLPFELNVSKESIETFKAQEGTTLTTVEIARKYTDGSSDFTFEKASDTEYLFSFLGTWGGNDMYPSIHTGELDGVAILKDGKLHFQGDDEFTKDCSFVATFKGNKMFLESESGDVDCGFGANVTFGTEYTSE